MKKRIIILGGVILAVILAWSGAWLFYAGMVRQNIEAMALADAEIMAPTLECETLDVGGFPFRFDVDCVDARVVSGDVVIEVPGIRGSVRVYALDHMLVSALGPAQITDHFTGTRNAVAWAALEASLRLEDARIARASVSAREVVWSDRLFGETMIARSPLVELHLFDIPEQHVPERFMASLAVYGLAREVSWPGLTLSGADVEVQLELAGLPDDIANWGHPMLLPIMQQAGASLRIVAISGTDADSSLEASGELQLDAQGLPEGQISITSTGVAERIGPLLEEPWRTMALGVPGEDGVYANQLNFRGGVVYSGLVPIAGLSPLF